MKRSARETTLSARGVLYEADLCFGKCIAGLAAGVLFAQSDSDYQTWMKAVAASNGTLQKGIAAKDGGAVVADAQKLQDTFKQAGDFWQKRGAADAVTFAKQAETAAAAVSKSAANGNMDQASTDAKTLAATCGGLSYGSPREIRCRIQDKAGALQRTGYFIQDWQELCDQVRSMIMIPATKPS